MFPILKHNLYRRSASKYAWLFLAVVYLSLPDSVLAAPTWWEVQSIDTMKISRDMALEKLEDPTFDATIDRQVKQIADTGATHVAIGTPYDERFVPYMQRWVSAARKYNLSVWFRGNLAGWEGWFNTPRISREEHTRQVVAFIKKHPTLFINGDIFTSCPECENGGPGDPRHTGDIVGHRQFLITEHVAVNDAFASIRKKVTTSYYSMNADVAKAIMDKPTTRALGGVIAIDHYVAQPTTLAEDVKSFIASSGAKVILGEFGAPIPDIHGRFSPSQQAQWVNETLNLLAPIDNFIGVNYWTGYGGSTALWEDNGQARPVVSIVRNHFKPKTIQGKVLGEFDSPLKDAVIKSVEGRVVTSEKDGSFTLPYLTQNISVHVSGKNYASQEVTLRPSNEMQTITLQTLESSWWTRLVHEIRSIIFFWE